MDETTFTHLTFEEWKERNQDVTGDDDTCPCCDGEGTHVCECGDEHDCGECWGTGKKSGGVTMLDKYNAQLKADEEKLKEWLSKQEVR